MRDQIDEALSGILGSSSNYTLDEIKAAERRKRIYGGTLLDNLRELTGRSLPTMESLQARNMDIRQMCELRGIDIDAPVAGTQGMDSDAFAAGTQGIDIGTSAAVTQADLLSELTAFQRNLEQDFGAVAGTTGSACECTGKAGEQTGTTAEQQPAQREVDPAAFNGVADAVGETVFGQAAFIRKLVIAFKRPFVMPPEDGMPRNSIYVTGGENTGRHFTVKCLAAELAGREILSSDAIATMDMSLYPTQTEEKLFLQDLYQALQSKAQIIIFENYDACHRSYLNTVSELVMTGSCRLSARYIMQNGQLVGINNALASDAVGTLSAKDKYLIFVSTDKLEKLADCFGAPFINELGDVCATESLNTEALRKIAEREQAELIGRSEKQLKLSVTCSEDFADFGAGRADKQSGLAGILDFYEGCLKSLAGLKLEREPADGQAIALSITDGAVTADLGGERISLLDLLPGGYTGEIESVKKELDSIVGLTEIKEYILSLEEYYAVQQRRRAEGLKASEVSKHMIFTGSPGTGKTTIARIISRYLKAIGVLSGGQLVEVSRADLVGRYVGHTAPLTNQVIASAIGGVLFIDEAYSLYRGKDDSFGLEAIDTLVKGIEDNRDNLIVILAGYSYEMEEFLTSNSGLKSRFPNIINFPDYTGEELLAIADINASSKGYQIDEGVKPALLAYFNAVQALRAADAGNGRLARNKIEEAILNQSRRLVAEPEADLSLLTSMDFDLNDI